MAEAGASYDLCSPGSPPHHHADLPEMSPILGAGMALSDVSCKRELAEAVTALLLPPLKVSDGTEAGPANAPRPGCGTPAGAEEAAVRGYLEASNTHPFAHQPAIPAPGSRPRLREHRHIIAHAPEPPA